MGDTPIPTEDGGIKDLGVLISANLKPSSHIAMIVRKAEYVLGLIRRGFRHLDQTSLCNLFISLVRPILEFSSCAWSPHLKRDSILIERVQHRFTRLFQHLIDIPYEQRLFILGLQSLERRRIRSDMIMTFRIVHGLVDCNLEDFFTYDPVISSRGHCLKLRVPRIPRLDARKFNFVNRVVSRWNQLPEGVVTAPSLGIFKSMIHDSVVLND